MVGKKAPRSCLAVLLIALMIFGLMPVEQISAYTKQQTKKNSATTTEVSQLGPESIGDNYGELPNLISWEDPEYDKDHFIYDGKLEKEAFDLLKENGKVDVIVRYADRPDMAQIYFDVEDISEHTQRVTTVIKKLQNHFLQSQKKTGPVIFGLEERGYISNIQELWSINGFSATITAESLDMLLENENIGQITLDRVLELPDIEVTETEPDLPQWGLEKINAPDVWGEYGIDGEGVIVGIMDTGVDWTHPALRNNYLGRDGNHEIAWADFSGHNYSVPSDGHGHGTHVAGTAVGGGEGRPVGVAPGAQWIAAKIFSDGGSATSSGIHAAFQWFLAPGGDPSNAPHVVNNSWGNADTYRLEFYEDVQAWVAAGIFPLFSAGNSGPGSGTIGSPGSYPEAFAVGATDLYDQVGWFSSRGPVHWPDEDGNPIYYRKPQVTAPGDKILSSYPGGRYAIMSGTSMAAPHVTGAIALILDANPNLSIDEIADLLEDTTRKEYHMGSMPNDLYGSGIVNVYSAVTATAFAGEISGTLTDTAGNPLPGHISIPGENINIDVPDTGEFSFLIREGTHKVTISSFGYETSTETITVEKDEVVNVSWQLAASKLFTFSGTIAAIEDGNPIKYAFVRINGTPLEIGRANSQGIFSIQGIPQGTYSVSVSGEGIKPKILSVVVHDNLDLTIEAEAMELEASDGWNTANNNIHRNAVTNQVIAADKLKKNWYYESSGLIQFASPAVAEGMVVVPTDHGSLVAIDVDSGEKMWERTTGITNRCSPTIANGIVYVGGGSDWRVYAIDLRTGLEIWQYRAGSAPVYESPLYHNGVLYLSAAWDRNAKVTALDAATGELLWESVVGDGTVFGASIGEDKLFVGTLNGRTLKALSLTDGSEIWSLSHQDQGFAARPVYHDGVLYAVSTDLRDGTLWAIDAATGNVLWTVDDIGDTQAVSPIVFDDMVIVGSARIAGLRAFDISTGQQVWFGRGVSTMLNNGAVTANGILFVADAFNMLQAVDVYSGQVLHRYELNDISSSGVAIIDGQVIVADINGINSFIAPGTISGRITDSEGSPIAGKVSLGESGEFAQADENGYFRLEARPGTYQLKVAQYGYVQQFEDVEIATGYAINKEYALALAEQGSLSGTLIDQRSGLPLEGVAARLLDTPLEATTDIDGKFSFDPVCQGTYELELTLGRYVKQIMLVSVYPNEHFNLNAELVPIDVAVLDDRDAQVTNFLNAKGIPAEERQWDVVDDIEHYQIVYLNGEYPGYWERPDEAQVVQLVENAKANDVDLIFADQWGISTGSIQQLVDFYGDPKLIDDWHGGPMPCSLQVDVAHPIFAGYEVGDSLDVLNGYFSWFNQYSGRNLATIGNSSTGQVGTGIAYKAVSQSSAHLLLSSHAACSWNSPTSGWKLPQQNILINSINYLLNTEFGGITGTITDKEGNPVPATIEVVETGVFVQADETTGAFEVFHDEGVYTLSIREKGYATQTVSVQFNPGVTQVMDFTMSIADSGILTGNIYNRNTNQVIPFAPVKLYDADGNLVAETVATINGFYEIADLPEATYTVCIEQRDFMPLETEISLTMDIPNTDFYLWPAPKVAVIGDYYSGSLVDLLTESGMEAKGFSLSSAISSIQDYDVVFYTSGSASEDTLNKLLAIADENQISIIFGDSYYGTAAINQLVMRRGDPETREQLRSSTQAAQYVVMEKNPIFGDAEIGDRISILLPTNSSVGVFKNYSGFPLAGIALEDNADIPGMGVAYRPRTAGSMELLMSGHGICSSHKSVDYTEAGKDMFINAILWAAFTEFPVVTGTVTDVDGNPIPAQIQVLGTNMEVSTDLTDGSFELAAFEGQYQLQISAFGYQSQIINLEIKDDIDPLDIQLLVDETVGSLEGTITDESSGEGVVASVYIDGYPRETVSAVNGAFRIERIMPGSYTLVAESEGYLKKEIALEITAGGSTVLDFKMKPSPTIGIIVDAVYGTDLAVYLADQGWNIKEMFYTDLEMLDEVDIVFANSDFGDSYIPAPEVFEAFLKALDEARVPVIWTGDNGGRGSIRYLWEYNGDPAEEIKGSCSNSTLTGTILERHPILEGIEDEFQFITQSGNYYAFNGYTGHTIADVTNSVDGYLGGMLGYNGRTMDSVEILMANFTIGYNYNSGNDFWDPVRERILNNALNWALDNEEVYVGELRGQVTNDLGANVSATITIEETGRTFTTDTDGSFFLGLGSGTYTLAIEAFGHESKTFTVDFECGVASEENFVLTADAHGSIKGQVKGADTGQPIEGAPVQLVGTHLTTVTDMYGNYEFQVPIGTYQLRVTASGYTPVSIENIAVGTGEVVVQDINMLASQKIAIIASSTYQTRLIAFLTESGFEAEGFTNNATSVQSLIDRISDFKVVIFNDTAYALTNGVTAQLIEAADAAGVSIIFTSDYSGGPIQDLNKTYSDPETTVKGIGSEYVNYKVISEHPIFAGYEVGQDIKILDNGTSVAQWSAFAGYSGETLAKVTMPDGTVVGDGVAYKFATPRSVHILLASLKSGMYGSPTSRWTDDTKRILNNAVNWGITASLGEITGIVTDPEGNPIAGALVSIPAQGQDTVTNALGSYTLGVELGTHEVTVQARGFLVQSGTASIEELGQTAELNFSMVATDRASISGQIIDASSGAALSGVTVTLTERFTGAEFTATTGNSGNYLFTNLLDGEYQIAVSLTGYKTTTRTVTIAEGEDAVEDFSLSSFDTAVLGDWSGEVASFLMDSGFAAESRDWSILNDLYNYNLVIVNTSSGTAEQMERLVAESDKYETSLVFVGSWGVASGSIPLLEETIGYPQKDKHGYNQGAVYLDVAGDHPIFAGLDIAEPLRIHSDKSLYSTFKNYKGIALANIIVDGEDKGAAIAYDFRSANHMHLLLSSYAVNNMMGPNAGWTEAGKQVYVQAMEWARTAQQQAPKAPVWDEDHVYVVDSAFSVSGQAGYRDIVDVYVDGVLTATMDTNSDNTFVADLNLAAGATYELSTEARNFAGATTGNTMTVTVVAPPAIESPVHVTYTNRDALLVSGLVMVDGTVAIYNNGEAVASVVTRNGEFSAAIKLGRGENIITATLEIPEGVTGLTDGITVVLDTTAPVITDIQPAMDITVNPGDKVVVSFRSDSVGGSARFALTIPGLSAMPFALTNMEEVEPGLYKGIWTAPVGIIAENVAIRIEHSDAAGNMVVINAPGQVTIGDARVTRLEGTNRYATAVAVSQAGWETSEYIILARGDNYADALAGAPLAYALDAPILLTNPARLNTVTAEEIQRLQATKIIILGGTGAVSQQAEDTLIEMGLAVERIVGANRFETAALIAARVAPEGSAKAALVNGLDFPDALSVAAYAARLGMPILLTRSDSMPSATAQALEDLGVTETIVIGGNGVISDEVMAAAPGAVRISGSNRYATSVAVAEYFKPDTTQMYVATGLNFADALSGAVLAAKNNSGILLVGNTVPEGAARYLTEKAVVRVTIFGGEGAVSPELANELAAILK